MSEPRDPSVSDPRVGDPSVSDPSVNVFNFGNGTADGDATRSALLGGKGANLCEMTRIGLPVPSGFVITTEACLEYLAQESRGLAKELMDQVRSAMARLLPFAPEFRPRVRGAVVDGQDAVLVVVRELLKPDRPFGEGHHEDGRGDDEGTSESRFRVVLP